jgi:cold shock protein
MKGKVKFFDKTKAFGFIAGEDNKEYFVHETGIKQGPIGEDDEVTFDVEEGDKGPKAVNVEKQG